MFLIMLIGLLPVTGCQPSVSEEHIPNTINVIPEGVQPQDNSILEHARPYRVVSEGNIVNQDQHRTVGLWFITSENASGFEEYAQTAVQAVLDLYHLHGRDFTSVLLIPSDKLEYAGLSYAQANFAADGKGATGMTGDTPAKEGYWVVRAANRELNEQELAIAELWKDKQQDFPQTILWSSLSYNEEALRHYIADTLNIPYEEAQQPALEMREYELTQSFLDKFTSDSTTQLAGTIESTSGKWQTLSGDGNVLDLLVTDNEVWATTSGGVVRWDQDKDNRTQYTEKNGLNSNNVRKIILDSQGNIWVTCHVSGVSRFDGEKWESFTVKNGLCSDQTIAIAADKKGGVWVSAYWGVSHFDGKQWVSYSNISPEEPAIGGPNPMKDCQNLTLVDAELSAADVISVDSRGNVWFSSRGRGITRFDGKEWQTFTDADGLAKGGVNTIFEDRNGVIWFDSYTGITSFDGTQFTHYANSAYQSVIPRPVGQDILQDNQGNLWLAAYGGGVSRYDGNQWQTFWAQDGLPSDNAQDLFLLKDGYPGVITDKGVCRFDGTTWQPMTAADRLPEGKARVAVNDTKGNLWFGGEGGVIYYSE